MDPRYLLDTNICIYIRRERPERVLHHFGKVSPGEAAISVIYLWRTALRRQQELAA